jgi:hypothetical protein
MTSTSSQSTLTILTFSLVNIPAYDSGRLVNLTNIPRAILCIF